MPTDLRDAEAAQGSLQTYGGQVEDGIHEDKAVTLAVCLAADAVCEYLAALIRAVDAVSPSEDVSDGGQE